jgi:hypothetical protein
LVVKNGSKARSLNRDFCRPRRNVRRADQIELARLINHRDADA